jgi:hypothetical protein
VTKFTGSSAAAKLLGAPAMMPANRTKADSSKERLIHLHLQTQSIRDKPETTASRRLLGQV